jgi:hypothetical protein
VLDIGLILGGLGEYKTAVKLTRAACSLNDERGYVYEYMRRDLDRLETAARHALSPAQYEAAIRAGETLTLEHAVELALAATAPSPESEAIT